jgi:zinc protease
MSVRAASLALALALLPPALHAAEPAGDRIALGASAALYDGLRATQLPNGLRVFLKPIPGSTAVTTLVAYKVGSADEDVHFTGLSHYLEHLLFKGTATLKPGDIDRITLRAGGENNAYTTNDLTAYHFTFPAGRWMPALRIEADRMRNTRIDRAHEFDKEKGAVISELQGNEDTAWDLESKALLPLLFGKDHPYGHPVIGLSEHVRAANEKVIKAHYDRWYHPNNAALVIVGGFDPDDALAAVKKLFGPIPRGALPPRKTLPAKGPALPARLEMVSRFSVPRLLLGFPTVKSGDPDQPALGVLQAALGAGKGCRLYRALVEGAAVASDVGAESGPGRYPGWFSVQVELLPGKDRAAAEKLVWGELDRLRTRPLDAAELNRARQMILASTLFSQEGTLGLAKSIGEAVTIDSLDLARKYLPRVLAVTADDVRRAAKMYLDPTRSVTVWSVPPAKKAGPAGPAGSAPRANRSGREGRAAGAGFDLRKARRVELDNGLVALLFENHRLPLFEAHVAFRDASLLQPADKLGVALLTGRMLNEGTTRRTAAQITAAIEGVGGELSLGSSSSSVRVLSPDRRLALGVLLECLTQPRFPAPEFARARARLLAEIGESEALPRTKARQTFRALAYGKSLLGLPLTGTVKTASTLRPADCEAFHRRVYLPNNAILAVVGDFDSKALAAELRALTAGWKKGPLRRPDLPKVRRPDRFTQKIIPMPAASQLNVYLGHVGVRRSNPDFSKLLVMDYILGKGSGFTDRLSSRLRDREGLGYTVSASITDTAAREPGLFACYIGTDNDKFAKVKRMFLEELARIRDTKPTAKELADVKAYLTGSTLLQFATNRGVADQLLTIEEFKLGFNYLQDYQKAVGAVTAEDVQAVARKYIDPEHLILVAAGAIDQEGRPLGGK